MTDETDLPPGWAWDTLGAICGAVAQVTPGDIFTDEFTYLDISSIDNEGYRLKDPKQIRVSDAPSRARQLVLQGDVLFSTVRTYLKNIAYVDERFDGKIASTGFCVLRPADRIEGRYIYYYTLTRNFIDKVSALQRGVSYPAVRDVDVQAQSIPVAPAAEQRRIVKKIDELFSLIEAGEQALARARRLLERYRQSVLNAAVTGELTKEWRERHQGDIESGEDRLKRILKARREAWEKAELAKMRARGKPPTDDRWKQRYREPQPPERRPHFTLPRGWAWGRVDAFGSVQLGRQRAPQHHSGPHMRPYLRVANVFENSIDLSDVKRMNFTPDEYEVYHLQAGDVLLNEGQSKELVGRPAIYEGELEGSCFTNTLVRFRCGDCLLPRYALMSFMNYMHRGIFSYIAKITTNIAHLGADRFSELGMAVPPLQEQQRLIELVEEALSEVHATKTDLSMQSRLSTALRQSVLTAAFSGKLVPQDPADEPASVLLARIRAERAQPAAKPPKRPGAGRRQRKTPQLSLPIEERQT